MRAEMHLSAKGIILAWLEQKMVESNKYRKEIRKASSLGVTRLHSDLILH